MPSRTASCHCGQLRIEVEGEPSFVGICHCLACQQRTGSVFAALASFSVPYRVFGKATEFVRAGDQGAKFRFRFCPVCGTKLFHTEEGELEGVGVAVGTFATPTFRHLSTLSTIADVTPGFSYHPARRRSAKIPLKHKLCSYRTDSEVTPRANPQREPQLMSFVVSHVVAMRLSIPSKHR